MALETGGAFLQSRRQVWRDITKVHWPQVRKKENYGDSGDDASDAGGDDGDGAKTLLSFILIYYQ